MKSSPSIFKLLLFVLFIGNSIFLLGQNNVSRNPLLKKFLPLQQSLNAHRSDLSFLSQKAHQTMVGENIHRHMRERHRLRSDGKTIADSKMIDSKRIVAGNGSIVGTIYASDGVTPMDWEENVSISVYTEFGDEAGSASLSSTDGTYLVSGLSSGKYYVQVERFSTYQMLFYDGVTDWRNATLVNVLDGQQTKNINFRFKVQSRGAISGRITNREGQPMNDCNIIVYDTSFRRITETYTNADGYYVAAGLASGTYKVEIVYNGSENYSRQWYINADNFSDAIPIIVAEPDTLKNINIILERGGAIAGKIFDIDAKPILSTNLFVFVYDNNTGYNLGVSTEEGGTFLVPQLRSGSYTLFMSSYGDDNYLDYWYENAANARNVKQITVAAPDTVKDITVILQKGGVVTGVVQYPDNPPNGTIQIFDEQNNLIQSTSLSSNYTFLIPKLPSAKYKIYYSSGVDALGSKQPANQWYNGVSTFEEATPIAVHAPDTIKNIVLTLQRGGSISGRVLGLGGVPLSNTGTVDAYTIEEEHLRSGNILDLGNFSINGLGTGKYKLKFHYTGDGDYIDQWYPSEQLIEKAETISVTAPDTTQNISFNVNRGTSLEGYIADAFQNRISQREYLEQDLMVFDAVNGDFVISTPVTFIGGFQTKLLGGKYKISIMSINTNMSESADSFAVTYYNHGKTTWDEKTQILDLVPGSSTLLPNFVVETAGGVIEGTFYDALKRTPAAGVICIVAAYDSAGFIAGECGNVEGKTGKYRLSGLRPGTYYLHGMTTDFVDFFSSQWYDTIYTSPNSQFLTAKISIPQRAKPVTVGNAVTTGIDFLVRGLTGIQRENSRVGLGKYSIEQNYPNPFNPTTTIEYHIPNQSFVTLKIFDLLGREAATLVNERKDAGSYKVSFDGSSLSSGMYIYQLQAEDFRAARKMVLVK